MALTRSSAINQFYHLAFDPLEIAATTVRGSAIHLPGCMTRSNHFLVVVSAVVSVAATSDAATAAAAVATVAPMAVATLAMVPSSLAAVAAAGSHLAVATAAAAAGAHSP